MFGVWIFLFLGGATADEQLWNMEGTIGANNSYEQQITIANKTAKALMSLQTICVKDGHYLDLKIYDTSSFYTIVRATVECNGFESLKYTQPMAFSSDYTILAKAADGTDFKISVVWENIEVGLTLDSETNEYNGLTKFNVSGDSYVIRSVKLESWMIETEKLTFVQVEVSSDDQYADSSLDTRYEGKLMVTRDGNSLDDFYSNPEIDTDEAIRISFSTFGMITISNASTPILETGEYLIGVTVRPTSRELANTPKRVTLQINVVRTYHYVSKIVTLFFVSLLGIFIPLFARVIFDPGNGRHTEERPFQMKYWYITIRNWFWSGKKGITYLTFLLACLLIVSAFQVVHAKYESMASSGNRDTCFYNEKCYRPYGTYYDVSVNGIASNLPFMIHGVILIIYYSFAEAICRSRNHRHFDYSIPYSFGLAFISEGFGSLLYHICPSQIIFQFDTLFMFVITIIMIVGIFEGYSFRENDIKVSTIARHKAIRIPKLFAFFVGPVYFFNFMGNLNESSSSSLPTPVIIAFWIFFAFWLMGILIWSAYKLDLLPDSLNPTISCNEMDASISVHLERRDSTLTNRFSGIAQYTLPLKYFSFGCYCALVGVGYVLAVMEMVAFSIFVLGILVVAVVVLTLVFFVPLIWTLVRFFYYQGIKMIFKCAISRHFLVIIGIVIYVLIGCGVTTVSLVFFVVFAVTDKSLPAAQSREMNKECYLNDFYDTHDFWHLFASFGLLMMTMINVQISKPCRDCYMHYLSSRNRHLDSLAITTRAANLMRWKMRATRTTPEEGTPTDQAETEKSVAFENTTAPKSDSVPSPDSDLMPKILSQMFQTEKA